MLLADQKHRWETDAPLKVEEYLQGLPELGSNADALPDIKLQLAVGEFQARQAAGNDTCIDEYTYRFSDISDELSNRLVGTSVIDETIVVETVEIDNLCDEFEKKWSDGGEPSLDAFLSNCSATLGMGPTP